ncbi:phosphoribosylglycinamide formyltransferase [Devosia geojensis]|uniref:Phosphoribosylglycinamide formyltransferase n=1 Tax=Devosia geojensis TaxID=443610 RepID=A0A0F5FVD4_9HYPH|nr:phosphoribosylglycinamide formyltransferase [Devosia geojensis]KKB12793.1 phosphoribosylglycinamide formyltransferase [Devosia geojensis]
MRRKRVAILISGRGSNMSALIAAARAPHYPAEIVGVFSNRAAAQGLEIAAAEGIATRSLAQSAYESREAFDMAINEVLESWGAEIVCLAGFMRILSPAFIARWQGRMINVHPSLLPLYRGLDTHARALADKVAEHGCSVHFVTTGLDEGPVILQAKVPVLPDDTPETLAARVLVEEHRLYPEALRLLAAGEVSL